MTKQLRIFLLMFHPFIALPRLSFLSAHMALALPTASQLLLLPVFSMFSTEKDIRAAQSALRNPEKLVGDLLRLQVMHGIVLVGAPPHVPWEPNAARVELALVAICTNHILPLSPCFSSPLPP